MKTIAAALILSLSVSTGAIAQGVAAPRAPAPPPRIPGVSAAGMAIIQRQASGPMPGAPALMAEQQGFRQQLAAVLNAPAIDPAKLGAVLARGRALQAKMSEAGDGRVVQVIRALPAADRKPFLAFVMNAQRGGAAPPPR